MTGVIYEVYILPEFRRRGVATVVAVEAIRELRTHAPSKIQLEVIEGRVLAAEGGALGVSQILENSRVAMSYRRPRREHSQSRSRPICRGSAIFDLLERVHKSLQYIKTQCV